MKKRWIALGIAVLAGAGGYQAFQANKYRLPGIVQDWRDPVQPNRAVAWQQGPATPPTAASATRPSEIHLRSEEHTSELQSLMRSSSAVFTLQKNKQINYTHTSQTHTHTALHKKHTRREPNHI